ncbi:Beta-MPP [Aphelenchoides fujianensis]|nr:Beta-MPP [Aphelenchoides fujianensis]
METVFGALAVEGTSWTHEDNLPLQIAHTLVGQYDRTLATGLVAPTRLARAMKDVPEVESFMTTNYKDTGLSGIYFITMPNAAGTFAEMICKEWQTLAHVKVSEDELQRAKKSLYANMMFMLDGTTPICEDIGRQILCYGRRLSAPEPSPPEAVREVCNKYYIGEKFAYTIIGPTTFWPEAAVIENWLKPPSDSADS